MILATLPFALIYLAFVDALICWLTTTKHVASKSLMIIQWKSDCLSPAVVHKSFVMCGVLHNKTSFHKPLARRATLTKKIGSVHGKKKKHSVCVYLAITRARVTCCCVNNKLSARREKICVRSFIIHHGGCFLQSGVDA